MPATVSGGVAMETLPGVVLVIDDEKPVLEAVQDILELQGYQVLQAENGRLGLDLYKTHQQSIDLILLDWSMPEMNGSETFAALREFDPNVRVILSSGYSEMETTHNLPDKQIIDYLQKPYSLATLAGIINQHMPSKL
jgi:DNA-binding NtrC family response regulator